MSTPNPSPNGPRFEPLWRWKTCVLCSDAQESPTGPNLSMLLAARSYATGVLSCEQRPALGARVHARQPATPHRFCPLSKNGWQLVTCPKPLPRCSPPFDCGRRQSKRTSTATPVIGAATRLRYLSGTCREKVGRSASLADIHFNRIDQ